MDKATAEKHARDEQLALVECVRSSSGYKGVTASSAVPGSWGACFWNTKKKRQEFIGRAESAPEAALERARRLGSTEQCDCYWCQRAAAPPAPPPPTEEQIMADAAAEGLTLARSDIESGFKYVMKILHGARPFKLHPAYAKLREGENSFATAAEAALALARLLGPDGSAEMAKPSPQVTTENVKEVLKPSTRYYPGTV